MTVQNAGTSQRRRCEDREMRRGSTRVPLPTGAVVVEELGSGIVGAGCELPKE